MLAHGSPLEKGTSVRATLRGPDVGHLGLDAVVQRNEIAFDGALVTALKFVGLSPTIEDQLQQLALRALERRQRPAVLIVHESPIFLAAMARDVAYLGYAPLLAVTEFDVVRYLHEGELRAVITELSLDAHISLGLFEFMRDSFPFVRRVAVARGIGERELARALVLAQADHALDLPWTPTMLLRALGRGERRQERRRCESPRSTAPP